MSKIPLYKPLIGQLEKKLVNEALDEGWISSKGRFVDQFENEFAKYVDRKYAIATANGTVALHLAVETLRLEKGTGILCPTLTYVSTANSIRYAGLVPIFVDCNEFGISEKDEFLDGIEIAKKNGIKVSAIMPVHLYGNQVNIDSLKELGLPIIEDCAESFGSTRFNKRSGSHDTEFACFSFFGNKTITTGEGGMCVTNNKHLYELALTLRSVGQTPNNSTAQRYLHTEVGYNYRLTNIASAIGVAQLQNADYILSEKRRIADTYRKFLPERLFLHVPNGCVSNNWLVTIVVDNNTQRDGLMLYLNSNNIETRPVFLPMHAMPHLGKFLIASDTSASEFISSCGLNLPSFPELTNEEIKTITSKINEYLWRQ